MTREDSSTTHIKTQLTIRTCPAPKNLQQFSEGIEVPKNNLTRSARKGAGLWTCIPPLLMNNGQEVIRFKYQGDYLLIIFATTVNIKGWTESLFLISFVHFFSWLFQEVCVRILRWSIDL